MNFFDRLSNGWKISMNSLKVLKANRQLILFPILSGLSLVMLLASFTVGILAVAGWDVGNVSKPETFGGYALIFYTISLIIL